jgi:hypothetical protein
MKLGDYHYAEPINPASMPYEALEAFAEAGDAEALRRAEDAAEKVSLGCIIDSSGDYVVWAAQWAERRGFARALRYAVIRLVRLPAEPPAPEENETFSDMHVF